jgi:hypothetical protein
MKAFGPIVLLLESWRPGHILSASKTKSVVIATSGLASWGLKIHQNAYSWARVFSFRGSPLTPTRGIAPAPPYRLALNALAMDLYTPIILTSLRLWASDTSFFVFVGIKYTLYTYN